MINSHTFVRFFIIRAQVLKDKIQTYVRIQKCIQRLKFKFNYWTGKIILQFIILRMLYPYNQRFNIIEMSFLVNDEQ